MTPAAWPQLIRTPEELALLDFGPMFGEQDLPLLMAPSFNVEGALVSYASEASW